MPQAFERRQLLAALRPGGGRQHGLLVPAEQPDGLVEMAQLHDLGPQRHLGAVDPGHGALGHAQLVRRLGD